MAQGKPEFKGFSLAVNAKNEAEADRMFAALGRRRAGAACRSARPSSRQRFGMVADKFGVGWMVMVEQPRQRRPEQPARS